MKRDYAAIVAFEEGGKQLADALVNTIAQHAHDHDMDDMAIFASLMLTLRIVGEANPLLNRIVTKQIEVLEAF